jgi:hypothetical protein
VRERIFKLGDIRDPISGELVVAKEYRRQMDEVTTVNTGGRWMR